MGFGFNLFFILVLVPLTVILLLVAVFTRSKHAATAIVLMWAGVIALVIISMLVRPLSEKKVLSKADYYGTYIIDRSMFPGSDADWQYNSFRFEITPDDSIHFHVTDGPHVIRTYKGCIHTVTPYSSARLVIHMAEPHHVLDSAPTTYRDIWSFFLVLRSPLYHNMYFKKGCWKPVQH